MNKKMWLVLGVSALCAACSDSKSSGDLGDLAAPADMPRKTHKLSGITIDIDKLAGYLAMHPTETDSTKVFAAACVPSTPVYGQYESGGKTDTVMAGA